MKVVREAQQKEAEIELDQLEDRVDLEVKREKLEDIKKETDVDKRRSQMADWASRNL